MSAVSFVELVKRHATRVQVRKWYEDAFSVEREDILAILFKQVQNGIPEECVIIGPRGSWMDRIFQVLADYLDANPEALNGHSTVYRLDLNEALGTLGNGEIAISPEYNIETATRDLSGSEEENPGQAETEQKSGPLNNSVLIIDGAEQLDSRLTDPQTRHALRAALRAISKQTLVVILYWYPYPESADRHGVLANVPPENRIIARPYSSDQTRNVIFRTFASKWYAEHRCQCYKNAFDTLLMLEPWMFVGDGREVLPYFAVYLGKNTTKSLRADYNHVVAHPGAESLYTTYADEAAKKVRDLRGQIPSEFQRHLDPAFKEALSDLTAIANRPHEVGADGNLILRRGHITARLLGSASYRVDLHARVSAEPQRVNPWPNELWVPPSPPPPKDKKETVSGL